jgi:electron transport complex protein RnfG
MSAENLKTQAAAGLRHLGQGYARLKQRVETADYDRLRTLLQYQTLFLAGLAFASALLLGIGDLATSGAIAQRLDEDMQASLRQVLPSGLYDNQPLRDVARIPSENEETGYALTDVYLAKKGGQVTGVAFRLIAPDGYAGNIILIMGVDRSGQVLGVRVIAHAETPGLGDKIEAAKSAWIKAFDGRSLDNTAPERWKVKKDGGDFDQFAGATITPRAVVKRVEAGLRFFQRHRVTLVETKP